MDDIDDLLDEVETKYVHQNKKSESKSKPKTTVTVTAPSKQRNAVDDAISDILDLDLDDGVAKKGVSSNSVRTEVSFKEKKEATKKCFPVFLGGSKDEVGLGTTVKTRACDQLRCTACDFRVSFFEDFSWKKETNYLFLRNNVPDFQKLKSNLRRQKGCRAYCCQCSWKDVQSLQELSDPNLKWVCGKHAL